MTWLITFFIAFDVDNRLYQSSKIEIIQTVEECHMKKRQKEFLPPPPIHLGEAYVCFEFAGGDTV